MARDFVVMQTSADTQILRSKIENHVKRMKNGKAAGGDAILEKMIEAAGEFMIQKIRSIANRIYHEGYIPEAMRESVLVTIP